MESRTDDVDVSQGVLLTDDFAPADLYNALRRWPAEEEAVTLAPPSS